MKSQLSEEREFREEIMSIMYSYGDKSIHVFSPYFYILIMCWALWYNRNQRLHGNKRRGAQDLVLFARDYMTEFVQVQHQHVTQSVSTSAV